MNKRLIWYLLFLFLFVFPEPSYAYLDPGTGSYLFQILIAGLLGGMFFFKSIMKKIKQLFKDSSSGKKRDENY